MDLGLIGVLPEYRMKGIGSAISQRQYLLIAYSNFEKHRCGKGIDHPAEFCLVHFAVYHRQAHAAETKVLFHLTVDAHSKILLCGDFVHFSL